MSRNSVGFWWAVLVVLSGCGGGGGSAPPPPTPPSATSATLSLDEDTSVQGTMSGVAGENGALSFSVRSQPTSGALTTSGADFTYTPSADFFGADSFTFVAIESGRTSAVATVMLTVNGVNDAPVSADSSVTLDEDTVLQSNVDVTDVDGDTIILTIDTQPANGVLTLGADTAFSYEPVADFFGTDSFIYTASDGAISSGTTTVNINVLSVNDAPVVAAQSLSAIAGTPLVIDLTGTDVENDALTYTVTSAFSKSTITNDPVTSGMADVIPTYGTWGADQASFIANDGQVDSAPANIDLDIRVPNTTSTISVQTYDAAGAVSLKGVVEGRDDTLLVVGDVNGDFVPGSNNVTAQQFVGIHDASGSRVSEVYLGGAGLRDIALGVNNDQLFVAGPEVASMTTVRFFSLDANNNAGIDVQRIMPYAITRDFKSFLVVHVPTVGFYLIGNDNQLTWIDYLGTVQSTTAIPGPVSTTVHSRTANDVRVVNGTVYIAGGVLECTDDGSQCFGGSGTKGYVLTADMSGIPIEEIELSGFPHDASVLDDGRVASHIGETLFLLNTDASVVWQRAEAGIDFGQVGLDANDNIYWWALDRDTGNSIATRLTAGDTEVWRTVQPISALDYLWPNNMVIDSFGNMFVSVIDRYNNVDAFGRLINIHFDYSGSHQWTVVSEPSDLKPNTGNARSTILTTNNRLVSIAADNIGGAGADSDGYLFINAVQ